MRSNTVAIVPASGIGRRMGGVKKQFLGLDGVPVIVHTLKKFQKCDAVDAVYLVVSQDSVEYCQEKIVRSFGLTKVKQVIKGGGKRQDSVYNGLKLAGEFDIVLVHDGVRPFLTTHMITESINTAAKYGSAVAAVLEKDTIKEVDERGTIIKTLDRDRLRRIQTPQAFKRELLVKAFQKAMSEGYYGTDESSLVEKAGYEVKIIEGSEFNIKITTKEDLALAEFYVKGDYSI